jgi:hypothetical protein
MKIFGDASPPINIGFHLETKMQTSKTPMVKNFLLRDTCHMTSLPQDSAAAKLTEAKSGAELVTACGRCWSKLSGSGYMGGIGISG